MGAKELEDGTQAGWDLGQARFLLALDIRGRVATLNEDERARVVPDEVAASTLDFLERARLPSHLRDFLLAHSYDKWVDFGHFVLTSTNRLRDDNENEGNAGCLRDRLFVVGGAVNGDPVVLDLATGLMGFVHHDLVWEDPDLKVRAEAFVPTPLDFGSFWLAAALLPYRGHEEDEREEREAQRADDVEKSDSLCFPSDAYGAGSMTPEAWREIAARLGAFELAEGAAQGHVARAWQAYATCTWTSAEAEARAAYELETTDTTWAGAVTVLAWLAMTSGDAAVVRAWLECLPARARPDDLLALTLALVEGQPVRAKKLASSLEEGAYQTWGPFVEGLAVANRRDLLVRLVAQEALDFLPHDVARRVVQKLFLLGAYSACKRVLTWLFEQDAHALDAYNLACVASRAESPREGLAWLQRALERGFADLALVAMDQDLAAVRRLKGFAALANKYGVSDVTA